jgi:phosphatidylglycerol:prolipoprotein diacylglycerol transferase
MAEHYAGLGLLCGVLAAAVVAGWLARRSAIAVRHIVWIAVLGVAGERLLLPILRGWAARPGAQGDWLAWAVPSGNLYVGLGFAVVPPLLYCVWRRLPLTTLADVWAPAALLVVAGARVDCFLRGCCWGDVCYDASVVAPVLTARDAWQIYTIPRLCGAGWPLAVTFPYGSPAHAQHVLMGLFSAPSTAALPCHPTQLYEATGAVLIAAVLLWRFSRRTYALQIWCWAVGAYCLLRFGLEFLRADHEAVWHGLTGVQAISLLLLTIVVLCAALARRAQTHQKSRTGRTSQTSRTNY